jgi:NADH dehydrogenase [ubiquinone] 1 alpha subcomplex assembly factor 7
MELALQHPEHGYYRQHDPLGKDGDFVTAPEISQMFGEMLGLWCADTWQQMGKPDKFVMLEMGPGRGTLMDDALRATSKIGGFHESMQLVLMESNETLRKLQQDKLGDYRPNYIEHLTDLPALPALAIANEFLDALPIRQFEKTFQGWCERLVTLEDGKLSFTPWPLEPMLIKLIPEALREGNIGTIYEVSPPSLGVVRTLAKHVVKHGGAALFIDYGFVEASGQPTLQAVSRHEYTDALMRPGEIDLTAHVDFSTLKFVAQTEGAFVAGPLGQGDFLQALGIDLRAVQLKQRTTAKQATDIDAGLQRLTDPAEMGVLFKAMAVASPQLGALAGF